MRARWRRPETATSPPPGSLRTPGWKCGRRTQPSACVQSESVPQASVRDPGSSMRHAPPTCVSAKPQLSVLSSSRDTPLQSCVPSGHTPSHASESGIHEPLHHLLPGEYDAAQVSPLQLTLPPKGFLTRSAARGTGVVFVAAVPLRGRRKSSGRRPRGAPPCIAWRASY